MNKLIKLTETHYIIVDDSKIKEGDKITTCGDIDDGTIFISTYCKGHLGVGQKITHSTQPLEEIVWWEKETRKSKLGFDFIKPLSLSEVEEAIYGYSVEKIKSEYNKGNNKDLFTTKGIEIGIEIGFKAHQELVKDKLFTIDDIEKAIEIGEKLIILNGRGSYLESKQLKESFIQSLQKTEWNIEFDEQGKIKIL